MNGRAIRRVAGACLALGMLGVLVIATWGRCGATDPWYTGEHTADAVTPVQSAALAGEELGNTFEGFGAANWAMGRYPGYQCALAFIPRASKTLAAMWVCWKTAPGYGAGTYGIWSFELQRDAPREHLPSGTALARVTDVTNPPDGYLRLDLPDTPLKAGDVYHLVTRNTDADPARNWSSPNTIMSFPDKPWRGEGVLSFDGRSWREWGPKDNRCAPYRGSRAAYLLEYTDGTKEGMPYYFAEEARIYGAVCQGEQFTWKRPEAKVRQFGVSVFAIGEPRDDLRLVLEETKSGAALMSAVAASADAMTELPQWQRVTLEQPVTLRTGEEYRLYLSAPACTATNCYATFVVCATSAVPGWGEQTWGGLTACAVTRDGAWKKTPVPADLSFSMIAE